MATSLEGLTLIGHIAVDSGQAMVGDPCYLDNWEPWVSEVDNFEDHVNKKGQYGYLGACNATLTEGFGQLGSADAVVFSTGYGDGIYPVYAKLNGETTVDMVVIDFTGALSDDE